MSTPPERFKVAYKLRFDSAALPVLGSLCASVNLEVLNTTVIGREVHILARMCPDDGDSRQVHARCACPNLYQPSPRG
jgi:hypothetical protein